MKATPSAEQEAFSASIRTLLTRECSTSLVRAHAGGEGKALAGLWRALADQGIFGLALPGTIGGEDGSLLDLAFFYREAGYALVPPQILDSIGFGVAVSVLADDEVARRVLTPLLSGSLRAAVSLSDPDDDADCVPRLRANRHGGNWSVSGQLSFVPDADADVILAPVSFASGGIGVVCLDPAADGVRQQRLYTQSRQPQCHLVLSEVMLNPDSVVVPPDDDPESVLFRLRRAVNALAALRAADAVGGAERVLDLTVQHVLTREQFGRPLGAFQAVAHHIADMRIAVQGARLTAYQAAWAVGRGAVAEREVVIAALTCHQAFKTNTLTAHQLHGGMGYLRETDLHLWSERAKLLELRGGGREVLLRRLANHLSSHWQDLKQVRHD